MYISNKLREYVKDCMRFCNSNVLITDLTKIQMIEILAKDRSKIIIKEKLHLKILNIIVSWNKKNDKEYYMFNGRCLKLFENDNNLYSAQMIFPLYNSNNLIGLIIFFRTDNNYIISSVKSVESCISFVNKFILEGE